MVSGGPPLGQHPSQALAGAQSGLSPRPVLAQETCGLHMEPSFLLTAHSTAHPHGHTEAQTSQVPESPPALGGVALGLSSPSLPAASGAVSVWTVRRS